MRRRAIVWFAVVAAVLVATAAPASAATVVSINTTVQDFQNASLSGMEISGSGSSAVVTGEVGYKESVDFGPVDSRQSGFTSESGYVFNVSDERGSLRGDIGDATVTTAYLRYDSNNTLIESKTVSQFGSVTFDHDFAPGVDYRLTADAAGASYDTDVYSDDTPLSDGVLTVSDTEGNLLPTVYTEIETGFETVSYRGDEHNADAQTLFADVKTTAAATVTAQANTGSGWADVTSTTIYSDQNVSLDISASAASRYRTVVEASETGNARTVTVEDEGVAFNPSSPTLSNPDPGEGADLSAYDGDISADLSDGDFGLQQADSVTVSASNSQGEIGETTLTSNGTATLDYFPLGGANNITWTANDSYGNSDVLTQNFTAPDRIEVRNVTNTSELVDNAEVTIQFFRRNNDTVIRKTTSNGAVSMTGLPVSETYLVTVQAPGYVTRKAIVQPLNGQQTVYLLNESTDSAQVVFELSDPTGEFPPGETYLYIEKPINVSGSTEYRVITADTFGSTSSYSVVLQTDTRYRLRVAHDGTERGLGYYEATVPTTEILRIDRIAPQAGNRSTGVVYGTYNQTSQQIAVRFRGGEDASQVTYSVTNETGATVVPQTTVNGSSFAHIYPVSPTGDSPSYTVDYTIEHPDGSETSDSFAVGALPGIADGFDIDPQVLSLASWVAILSTMGLVVIVDKTLAPAAGAGMASVLTILGTVAIPAPLLGVSGAIGVLAIIGGR